MVLGPVSPLHPTVVPNEAKFDKLIHISIGRFTLYLPTCLPDLTPSHRSQVLCIAIISPLLSKSLLLACFTWHKVIKIVIGILTITSLLISVPIFFPRRECLIAFILLLPSFPLLHFTTTSQYWMRKWYQVRQLPHMSYQHSLEYSKVSFFARIHRKVYRNRLERAPLSFENLD